MRSVNQCVYGSTARHAFCLIVPIDVQVVVSMCSLSPLSQVHCCVEVLLYEKGRHECTAPEVLSGAQTGWRQTVQQLVDRFKEAFVPINEDGDLLWPSPGVADFDALDRDDRQRVEAQKLAVAAQDASQNPGQLVRLRQHFQKVSRRAQLQAATFKWRTYLHSSGGGQHSPVFG